MLFFLRGEKDFFYYKYKIRQKTIPLILKDGVAGEVKSGKTNFYAFKDAILARSATLFLAIFSNGAFQSF